MTYTPRILWLGVLALTAAVFAVQVFTRLAEVGSADTNQLIADWTYRGLMIGSTFAVLIRAVLVPRRRLAWTLFGIGLAAWSTADLYYFLALSGGSIPYPSLSDFLYLLLYVAFLAGLHVLGARGRWAHVGSFGMGVSLLGLATLWSWLVFGHVVQDASGESAAVATTLAYPLLDLALIASAVVALAARGWRIDRVIGALLAGLLLMAVGDAIYAAQTAEGSYVDGTVIETFWPAGALAIAAAAWMDRGPAPRGAVSERSGATLTAVGIAIAVVALIGDHFSQIDTLTFILAALTLLGGIVQLGFLYRDRMQARMAVAAAKTLRSVSSDAALDCVVSIDADGKVCEWNDAARHTFGYRGEYAVGRDLAELIVPHEQQASHHAGLARWLTTGESRILNRRVEMMAVHAQGHRFPVELTITQVRVDPPMFTGFLRDISEAKRQGEENDRLAAIVRSSEDAIHSTDLDGLATAWNHGAELLYGYSTDEAVGKRLEDLIVPRDLADELKQMTKRVLDGEPAAVETKRLRKNGGVIDVSLRSFPIRDLGGGVTGASTSAYDITQRKRREEHDAKNAEGRLWRGRVEAALRDETFMFWGQPVVDVQTGAVHHHELLLRMDLDGDVITPNHFLPHAEDGELITEIDRWAIREGVAFAKKLPVAINLSARSLGNPGVIDQITSALGDRKLASRVIFEITETAAVANLDTARDVVEELVAIGCGVALDDFGTGYGSFTHIEQLPVTELKIDMSFVQGLARTPTDQRLVRSIIAIARNFDMKTVAEGVEDVNTLTLLRRLGVDYVQGYYVGYPAQMTSSGRWPAATQMSSSSIRQATEPLRPPDLRPEKRHEAPHRARRTHPID